MVLDVLAAPAGLGLQQTQTQLKQELPLDAMPAALDKSPSAGGSASHQPSGRAGRACRAGAGSRLAQLLHYQSKSLKELEQEATNERKAEEAARKAAEAERRRVTGGRRRAAKPPQGTTAAAGGLGASGGAGANATGAGAGPGSAAAVLGSSCDNAGLGSSRSSPGADGRGLSGLRPTWQDDLNEPQAMESMPGCQRCEFAQGGCEHCRKQPMVHRPMARWRPHEGRPQLGVTEAPTFYPTAEQFADPFAYVMSIYPEASKFGICRVVPPEGWAPPFALEKGTSGDNSDSFVFHTRRQFTSHLCMRYATSNNGGGNRYDRGPRRNAAAGNAAAHAAEEKDEQQRQLLGADAAALQRLEQRTAEAEQQQQQQGKGQGGQQGAGVAIKQEGAHAVKQQQREQEQEEPMEEGDEEEYSDDEFGFTTTEWMHTLRSFAAYAEWAKRSHFSAMPCNAQWGAGPAAGDAAGAPAGGSAGQQCGEKAAAAEASADAADGDEPPAKRAKLAVSGSAEAASIKQQQSGGSQAAAGAGKQQQPCTCKVEGGIATGAHAAAGHAEPSKAAADVTMASDPVAAGHKDGQCSGELQEEQTQQGRCESCRSRQRLLQQQGGGAAGAAATGKANSPGAAGRPTSDAPTVDAPSPNEAHSPTVHELEAEFWRVVERPEPSRVVETLYGQDLDSGRHGSGFPLPLWRGVPTDARTGQRIELRGVEREYAGHAWNINNMPRSRDSVLRYVTVHEPITGVMVPWLYVGSCLSAFCWHIEDHALYSINYLHTGADKVWYGVPAHASEAMEAAMRDALPHLFEADPNLMHRLVTMVSPNELRARGIPVSRIVHSAGSFVITMPNAYHAGFNTGFNVAEAVNFGPANWLPYGTDSVRKYRAQRKPVTVSHDQMLHALVSAAPEVARARGVGGTGPRLSDGIAAGDTVGGAAGDTTGDTAADDGAEASRAAGACGELAGGASCGGIAAAAGVGSSAGKGAHQADAEPMAVDDSAAGGRAGSSDAPASGTGTTSASTSGFAAEASGTDAKADFVARWSDGVDKRDVPVLGILFGVAEWVLRIEEEQQRREAARQFGVTQSRRMQGDACLTDASGVHLNTFDTDCEECACDLYMSAVVSPEYPGRAACPEHVASLGASPGSCVLLYKHTMEEMLAAAFTAAALFPDCDSYIQAAQQRVRTRPSTRIRALGPLIDTNIVPPKPPAHVQRDPNAPLATWVQDVLQLAAQQKAAAGQSTGDKDAAVEAALQVAGAALEASLKAQEAASAAATKAAAAAAQPASRRAARLQTAASAPQEQPQRQQRRHEAVADSATDKPLSGRRRSAPGWLQQDDVVLDGAEGRRLRSGSGSLGHGDDDGEASAAVGTRKSARLCGGGGEGCSVRGGGSRRGSRDGAGVLRGRDAEEWERRVQARKDRGRRRNRNSSSSDSSGSSMSGSSSGFESEVADDVAVQQWGCPRDAIAYVAPWAAEHVPPVVCGGEAADLPSLLYGPAQEEQQPAQCARPQAAVARAGSLKRASSGAAAAKGSGAAAKAAAKAATAAVAARALLRASQIPLAGSGVSGTSSSRGGSAAQSCSVAEALAALAPAPHLLVAAGLTQQQQEQQRLALLSQHLQALSAAANGSGADGSAAAQSPGDAAAAPAGAPTVHAPAADAASAAPLAARDAAFASAGFSTEAIKMLALLAAQISNGNAAAAAAAAGLAAAGQVPVADPLEPASSQGAATAQAPQHQQGAQPAAGSTQASHPHEPAAAAAPAAAASSAAAAGTAGTAGAGQAMLPNVHLGDPANAPPGSVQAAIIPQHLVAPAQAAGYQVFAVKTLQGTVPIVLIPGAALGGVQFAAPAPQQQQQEQVQQGQEQVQAALLQQQQEQAMQPQRGLLAQQLESQGQQPHEQQDRALQEQALQQQRLQELLKQHAHLQQLQQQQAQQQQLAGMAAQSCVQP